MTTTASYTVTRKAVPSSGWHHKARPAKTMTFASEPEARAAFVRLLEAGDEATFVASQGSTVVECHRTKGGLYAIIVKHLNADPDHKNKFWFGIEVWSAEYAESHALFPNKAEAARRLMDIHAGLCMAERAIAARSVAKAA